MIAKLKPVFFFSLLCLLSVGCTSRGYLNLSDQARQDTATNAKQVAVYVTEDAKAPYTTLGAVIVNSDAGQNATPTVEKLKMEAAKLGADAIVNLKLRYSYGFWGISLEASGMAVKLNP